MIPAAGAQHWVNDDDIAEVVKALRSASITQGPLIQAFEERVAAYCGARFAVAMSSGTAALHAACAVAGIGPGDEAITTPITFVATANAVVYQGGRPIFADIEASTLNIDPEAVAQRVSPRTKAIIPVHFAGRPCDLGRLQAIARRHGLLVIEDACHALGAEWRSPEGSFKRIGSCSHSDMAVLSFHPVKHITTGEGGMVLTNHKGLWERLRRLRHHGLVKSGEAEDASEPWHSEMQELGYNYRITDFQCALGLQQMERLESFLARRRAIAAAYQQAFKDVGVETPSDDLGGARHAWHLYVLQVAPERAGVDRRAVFEACRMNGLGVNVHYLPVHLHAFYRNRFGHRPGEYPVAERYYARAITLPLFPRMEETHVNEVIRIVRQALTSSRQNGLVEAGVASHKGKGAR